jgi:BirA family biotin operon repressor/biotin-[acetyl-CoA-carboxylase] ligase
MHPRFPVIEALEPEKIRAQVKDQQLERLTRLEIFNSIDSTNQYLLSQAKNESSSGWFCFAEQQTQGRGRLGRTWFSPAGENIYCSVLWRFPSSLNLSGLSLAVAVILGDVLHEYGVLQGIFFKWPNDILFSKRKLAGILCESLSSKNGFTNVVIGIGVNLQFPNSTDVEKNWIDLHEITKAPIQRNYFAGVLVDELLKQLSRFEQEGFVNFIDRWRDRDILNRTNVIVQMSNESIAGISQGIDENGALIVLTDDGDLKKFQTGEVSVRI